MSQRRLAVLVLLLLQALCLGPALSDGRSDPAAWYSLNADSLKTIGEVGVGITVAVYPPAQAYAGLKKAYDVYSFAVDSTTQAVDRRSALKTNDLLVIDRDTKYLNELTGSGQNWRNDPEGQRAHARLEANMKDQDGAFSFAIKAVASPDGAYVVVKNIAIDKIGEFMGDAVAHSQFVSKNLRFGTTADGIVRGQFTRAEWKKLATLLSQAGKLNQELNKKLREAIFRKAFKAAAGASLNNVLDQLADQILAQHPHLAESGSAPVDLRLDALTMPNLSVPSLALTPYTDPVIRPIELQQQLLELQAAPALAAPSAATAPPSAPVYQPTYTSPQYQPRSIPSVHPHVNLPTRIQWD